MKLPADFRIICSSVQFAAKGHRWEKWANFSAEKLRLLTLVDRLRLENLVVLSGDMHFGELSDIYTPGGRRILDLTSSGLNRWDPADGPNSRRISLYDQGPNYGVIEIDWSRAEQTLRICDEVGRSVISYRTESTLS